MQPSWSEGEWGREEEDISLTSSQGFRSHIFLHASAAKKVMHVASFEVAFSVPSEPFIGRCVRGGQAIAEGWHAGGQVQWGCIWVA